METSDLSKLRLKNLQALVEILEEYSELKSSGVKPSKERIEQWEVKFTVAHIEIALLILNPKKSFVFLSRRFLIMLTDDKFLLGV